LAVATNEDIPAVRSLPRYAQQVTLFASPFDRATATPQSSARNTRGARRRKIVLVYGVRPLG